MPNPLESLSKPFVQKQVSPPAVLWLCALAACASHLGFWSFRDTKGHTAVTTECFCNYLNHDPCWHSWGRMLHVLSVQRSFVLVEDIFLLGIVSGSLFLIVNLDVTCYSQVITTPPGLVCMPSLSVRQDHWGLEKYLMVQRGLEGKRIFLHHHLFDWSSHNASFSKTSCKLWSL